MRHWTTEETQFVKEYFNNYPTNEIATEIRRSVREIVDKAKELGILTDVPLGFKKCKDCNKIKTLEHFYKNVNCKDGANIYCKKCDGIRRRNNAILKKLKSKMVTVLEKEKLAVILKNDTENAYFECISCGQKKVGNDFYFDSSKLKRFNICIKCYLQKQKEKELNKILERGY